MNTFHNLQDQELSKVRSRGKLCKSWHEAYGLLAEEVEEFWDEVKAKPSARDRTNALEELVQIAALCQRIAEDLALVADYERACEANSQFDERCTCTPTAPSTFTAKITN